MVRATWLLVALVFVAGCAGSDVERGGEIALTVNDRGWNEIWLMAADGSDRRRLTDRPPAETDAAGSASPAWSPDGTRIVYAAQVGTDAEDPRLTELYVMRADGSDRRRLTTNDDIDVSPSWSPDGTRIALARVVEPGTTAARGGIFVMDADGGHEVQITQVAWPSVDASPTWSPDGSEIVFTRAGPDDSRGAIYAVASTGGGPRKLTDDGAEPAWSPDGKRIAFTSARDDFGQTCVHECGTSGEIYVLDVESGDVTRLTESEAADASPAWSPDGRLIAFVSDRSDREAHENEIYVMSPSGDGVRRLTQNDVWDLTPAWRP